MVPTGYAEFLASKARSAPTVGITCTAADVHPSLFDFQREIVAWAARVGRAAVWTHTGTGKTRMQLEWARLSADRALVVAPLAVCHQTVREAAKIGLDARYVRSQADVDGAGIWVTNYEMTQHFDPSTFGAVVLDESSVLKDVTSKTRDRMIEEFGGVPRRLACTATPAPNDTAELANHAEFLGVCTRREMLSTYFLHDQDGWRVKGHARAPLFRWMSTWAVALRTPSDIGFSDEGYDLPNLRIIPHLLPVELDAGDGLFPTLGGIGGRAKVRRQTLTARVGRTVEIVQAEPDEPWLLWCGLNDEADALAAALPNAVNVHGGWTPEAKADAVLAFADDEIRTLIIKPSIAAFGVNWQHCARMAFVGLSDSYETYFQAIRRCYRYGQTREVHAHVVLSDTESAIAANIARKQEQAERATSDLIYAMTDARSAA